MSDFRGSQKEVSNPHLRFLNEEQCRKVHEATLELLEKTGVWIDEPECLEMLRGAGARVVDTPPKSGSKYNRRVQMPAHLVEEAIRSAPESITIYNRQGEVAMVLQERQYYFGCHGDNPDFIDPWTNERLKMGYKEIHKNAALIDYLPNVEISRSGLCRGDSEEHNKTCCFLPGNGRDSHRHCGHGCCHCGRA